VHHGERTITVLDAGSTVGELAALVPEPRTASVTALEPTTLLRIDRAVLEELLADRPALASGIIAALVAMIRERSRTEANTTPA
jgi:CRP-like cAMP-binding protein